MKAARGWRAWGKTQNENFARTYYTWRIARRSGGDEVVFFATWPPSHQRGGWGLAVLQQGGKKSALQHTPRWAAHTVNPPTLAAPPWQQCASREANKWVHRNARTTAFTHSHTRAHASLPHARTYPASPHLPPPILNFQALCPSRGTDICPIRTRKI